MVIIGPWGTVVGIATGTAVPAGVGGLDPHAFDGPEKEKFLLDLSDRILIAITLHEILREPTT